MFESIVDDKPGNSQLELNLRVGNIVIVFLYVNNLNLRAAADVTVTTDNSGSDTQLCGNSSILVGLTTTVKCSVPWTVLAHSQNITAVVISAKFPDSKGTLYVKPGQGDPSDVDSYGEVIPLMAGSHLSGILSRTEPDLFSINTQDICGIATPYRQIMLTPVLHLQADPFPPVDTGPNNTVSLRLRMRANNMNPFSSAPQIQIVRDFTDSSGLNGLATAGGFWTFVNGAFAMVFGANILYFLFRRRSLSALGIVHVFQRRKLTQNWNEDFPALYTEGGMPGSRSAGIVAFLRERLVDLDDKDNGPADLEPQISPVDPEHHPLVVNADADSTHSCITGVDREVQTDPMEMDEILYSSGLAGSSSHR